MSLSMPNCTLAVADVSTTIDIDSAAKAAGQLNKVSAATILRICFFILLYRKHSKSSFRATRWRVEKSVFE